MNIVAGVNDIILNTDKNQVIAATPITPNALPKEYLNGLYIPLLIKIKTPKVPHRYKANSHFRAINTSIAGIIDY